jgi:hypothetical protein
MTLRQGFNPYYPEGLPPELAAREAAIQAREELWSEVQPIWNTVTNTWDRPPSEASEAFETWRANKTPENEAALYTAAGVSPPPPPPPARLATSIVEKKLWVQPVPEGGPTRVGVLPVLSPPGALEEELGPGIEEVPSGPREIPMWAWLAGGVGLLYLFSRK